MTHSRGRARFGILVPFTNTNLEPDMAMLTPEGVSMHFARLGGYDRDEIPDADQMRGLGASDMDETLEMLMGVRPDVMFYGCTSATLTHGPAFDRDLSDRITKACGAHTVTAAGALVFALKALGIKKMGFASPYVPAINDMAVNFLDSEGVQCVHRSEVKEELDNYGQSGLNPDAVFDLGLRADHAEAEALVLSCTDMRAVETIARLETATGKPVITSNQAMVFQAMHMMGFNEGLDGYGRLLKGTKT